MDYSVSCPSRFWSIVMLYQPSRKAPGREHCSSGIWSFVLASPSLHVNDNFSLNPLSRVAPFSRYLQGKLGQARWTAADWISSYLPLSWSDQLRGIDQFVRLQSALDPDITKVQESTFTEFDVDAQFCRSLVLPNRALSGVTTMLLAALLALICLITLIDTHIIVTRWIEIFRDEAGILVFCRHSGSGNPEVGSIYRFGRRYMYIHIGHVNPDYPVHSRTSWGLRKV